MTVRLADDIDIARGDLIVVDAEPLPVTGRELSATVCWLTDAPLRAGGRYQLRHTTRDVRAVVDAVRVPAGRGEHGPRSRPSELEPQRHRRVRIRLAEPVAADPYRLNRSTGSFLLVDESSGATVAAGLIR